MLSTTGDIVIIGGTIVQNRKEVHHSGVDVLDKLERHGSLSAVHTSSEVASQDICVPGTRTATLDLLHSLLTSTDPKDPDVIWLYGPAGAGKSTIVRTTANALAEHNDLLASFFFYHSDSGRNTWNPLIPTIAFQVAESIPSFEEHVRASVRKHRAVFTQSVSLQTVRLLGTPLVATLTDPDKDLSIPGAILVDGLDECSDSARQVDIIHALVRLASTIRSRTQSCVKIVIASRPESQIKQAFEAVRQSSAQEGSGGGVTMVSLGTGDANIEHYYDTHFDELRSRFNLPKSWPSLSQIQWLRMKTSGQYAFASIAIRFVSSGNPAIRLEILQHVIPPGKLGPYKSLDYLYFTVLSQIPEELLQSALMFLRFGKAQCPPQVICLTMFVLPFMLTRITRRNL